MPRATSAPPRHAALKARQRARRDQFPPSLGLRVHRAISWYGRAEQEKDGDVRFILLWVGFNAAYGTLITEATGRERVAFRTFFDRLVGLDGANRIYDVVWERFTQEITALLANKYVFAPFWNHHNGVPGYDDWEERQAKARVGIKSALAKRDTGRMLAIVFDRLYVLRNQLVHGGATFKSSVNRAQVRDGAAILGWTLPLFLEVMMEHPEVEWGPAIYPVVKE